MAIRIIEGVPGSGKTYYAVRHLAKNYFSKHKDGSYELSKNCTIITNIDSFQPDHISLQDEIKNAGGIERFFSFDYQEKYKEGKEQIVYIIDEAQRYFRKGNRKLSDVYTYFEYHRHWGQDIYLVTQNARKLPPDIVYLVEYVIVAAPRTRSILGEFKYKWVSGGEIIKREAFRPDKAVFSLYQSMDVEESEKISNPVMKTVYIVVALACLIAFSAYYYFKSHWSQQQVSSHLSNQQSINNSSQISYNQVAISKSSTFAPHSSSSFEVLIPVNSISLFRENDKGYLHLNIQFVWNDRLYTLSSFPYPLLKLNGRWFAVLEKSIFDLTFTDEDQRPSNVIFRKKKA